MGFCLNTQKRLIFKYASKLWSEPHPWQSVFSAFYLYFHVTTSLYNNKESRQQNRDCSGILVPSRDSNKITVNPESGRDPLKPDHKVGTAEWKCAYPNKLCLCSAVYTPTFLPQHAIPRYRARGIG